MAGTERRNGERSTNKHRHSLSPLGTNKRLAQLQEVGARRPTSSAETWPRGIKSMSRFGTIANERAAEAESELGRHFLPQGQQESLDGGAASNARRQSAWDVDLSKRAYDRLMEEINEAFAGPSTPIQVLRKDEVVSETVLFHSMRHYRISLPVKPTAITAIVKVSVGVDPTLYGSTSCERPNSNDHELIGRDNRLVYEHALLSTNDEHEGAMGLDRRTVVPSCRELFLGVEADGGECSFRLTVTFKHIKVVLSRAEIAYRMQNIRQGWKARLAQLHREPTQKEQFEEHVFTLQMERESAKRERQRGVNFVERNMRSLDGASPRPQLSILQKHDEVAKRRDKVEQELNLRNTCWISQREERRQRQAHEQQQQQKMQRIQEFQCQWLSRLAAVAFVARAGFNFQMANEEREHIRSRMWASGVVRKFMVRKLFRRRRTHLYSNVIKMRIMAGVFARMVQPAVMCASQSMISGFLNACAVNPESLTLGNALLRFRARVIRIQRWWLRIYHESHAHVILFLQRWKAIQASLEKVAPPRVAESSSSSARRSLRGGAIDLRALHQAGSQSPQVAGTMSHAAAPDPERSQVTTPGPMPASLVRTFVSDYISSMRRSYRKRMKKWEQGKQAAQWARDLEGFGVRADKSVRSRQAAFKRRPRRVYVDMEELDRIIRQHEEAWRSGRLKVERFQHLRPLRFPFATWAQSTK